MGEGENVMKLSRNNARLSQWMVCLGIFGLLTARLCGGVPQLGLQTWTCRNMSFDEMVAFADEHDLTRIQLFRAHFDPTDPANINAAKLKVMRTHGLEPYAMYEFMGRDDEQDRQMFDLAQLLGLEFLVVEPEDQSKWPELLAAAAEHGIKLAVHNHGLTTTYGDPATVHALLKKYPELFVCLDVGWVTAAGFDAETVFRSYGDRVIDLHFKDKRITETTGGTNRVEDTLPGEGDVNFDGLFAAIRETGWAGTMVIETDSNEFAQDPRELVQRSKNFFEARLNAAAMPREFDYTRDDGELPDRFPVGISESDTAEIQAQWLKLAQRVRQLRATEALAVDPTDPLADVEIYLGQVRRALRYEAEFSSGLTSLVKSALAEGLRRADLLEGGRVSWRNESERVLRGHRSKLDGSAQPYGVVVPASYDGSKPVRLDVVLHGSIRSTWGSASLRFANWFRRYGMGWRDADADYIELYPLGRVTNGYRFAGHEDIFEAIEAVCRDYRIDRDQILLRGFSMGASGTWHVGLKQPDVFAALGPYMGYVDTKYFSESYDNPRLIRVGALPDHEERVLPTMDAISYVANAGSVPVIAAMGGADPGVGNHRFMEEGFAREKLQMVNLIAPGVGHRVDATTHRAQVELMAREAEHRRAHEGKRVHFVTHSLRYPRSGWIELQELYQHDRRAEIVAETVAPDRVEVTLARNIMRFAIEQGRLSGSRPTLSVLGQEVTLDRKLMDSAAGWVIARSGGGWKQVAPQGQTGEGPGKKGPGVQGPIDDAFTQPFLCVRGTGQPWHDAVTQDAEARLQQFAYEWNRYWAGDLPIKDDRDVTAEDIRTKNLILFGDPGSNSLIAQILPDLPLQWGEEYLQMAGARYDAARHTPSLIYPSPLPEANGRYVVINSGHTFGEAALSAVAYLIYPRWGDWAVRSIDSGQPVRAGHFDEAWGF